MQLACGARAPAGSGAAAGRQRQRQRGLLACGGGNAAARRACVPARRQEPSSGARAVAARAVGDEEDLMQFPDRLRWYEAKFAADDMPDWNVATLLRRTDLAPGVASLLLSVEVSRERVPLRNAYVAAGQRARLRVNSGVERLLPVATAPPGSSLNHEALFMTKGDIFAGEIKSAREPVSTLAEVEVVVTEGGAPELYRVDVDDVISVGPFDGTGLDLRTSGIMAPFRYPTVVMFVSGNEGIAAARALLESPPDIAGLAPALRQDIVIFYHVPNDAAALYRDRYPAWAELGPVRVEVTTRGFADAFDGDATLIYDPDTTAAIILTGGDEESEAAAREVCAEAEIVAVASDAQPAPGPVHLDSMPTSFMRWAAQHPANKAAAAAGSGGDGGDDSDEEEGAQEAQQGGKVSVR